MPLMTLTGQKLTFAEFLALRDTEWAGRAEWHDGELIELPPESGFNNGIATFLFLKLVELGVPYLQVRLHACEVQVPQLQPGDAANRFPNMVVLQPEHVLLVHDRLTITLAMPPPRLVVEVVSPGKTNRDRDYRRKRMQYAAIGILEYVIIDPQAAVVLILRLQGNDYQEVGRYQGNAPIQSVEFPGLSLAANQVLTAGQEH